MSAQELTEWYKNRTIQRQKLQEKSDKLVAQELKDAHAWGEKKEEAELIKAVITVLRNADFPWVNAFMHARISGPEMEVTNTTHKVELEAARRKLVDLHVQTVEKIAEALDTAARKLPDNMHNMQEALMNFARNLDTFTPMILAQACTSFPTEMSTRSILAGPIYNTEDLSEEFQKGFEVGYKKAIQKMKESDVDERFGHIDLSE